MNNKLNMSTVGRNARVAAQEISEISDALITKTLILYSSRIRENKDNIVKANQEDIQLALHNNASKAFIDRLKLNFKKKNLKRDLFCLKRCLCLNNSL